MAVNYNPQIVTNGLVFYYDFANIKSYPGSGTAVSDLSANGKSGTTQNSPVYTTSNGGGLTFSSVSNHYVLSSNSFTPPSLPTGSSSRTLVACFKPTSLSGTYAHILHYGANATDQAFGIALFSASGYRISNHTWSGNSYGSTVIQPNNTYYACITYNDTSTPRNKIFVNGTFNTISYGQGKAADYAINTGTTFQLNIATRISPAEGFTGDIYLAKVYNRELSTSEIIQNYYAVKTRFGL